MHLEHSRTDLLHLMRHRSGSELMVEHLTALPRQPVDSPRRLALALDQLAAELQRLQLSPLQARVFGPPSAAVARALAPGFAALELPLTHVGCAPCTGGLLAGIQLWGVVSGADQADCRTLYHEERPVGRLLQRDSLRLAVLADVHGLGQPGEPQGSAQQQCRRMFQRAASLVQREGFGFDQVARTWIYAERLLDWYDDLNQVRDAAFEELGLRGPGGAGVLPASTGIQAAHPLGAQCFMDLLLVDCDGAAKPMRSQAQCEAADYGSSFSRGMKLDLAPAGGPELLLVSGTASIDQAGRTVASGDAAAQIQQTLSAAQAVLGPAGSGLRQMVHAVAYCKTPEVYNEWLRHQPDQRLEALPVIAVLADICRPELLFELEPTVVP